MHVAKLTSPDLTWSTSVDGHAEIVHDVSGARQPVFPPNFQVRNLFFVNHVLDRGSIGACAVVFAEAEQLLWTHTFGINHDDWNAIKLAAKAPKTKKIWNGVVRFGSVCNLNFGPYRSCAWSKAKQTCHTESLSELTKDSEEFRDAAQKQAALEDRHLNLESDFLVEFRRYSSLPSCVEQGPCLKFARWHSVKQCWVYYRKEWLYLPLVLKRMTPQIADAALAASTTAMLDHDAAEVVATSKRGLLSRAPSYCSQEVADALDVFCGVTDPVVRQYENRTIHVKTKKAGLHYFLEQLDGQWEHVFIEVVSETCYNLAFLRTLGSRDGGSRFEKNVELATAFMIRVISEVSQRRLGEQFQYPHLCVTACDDRSPAASHTAILDHAGSARMLYKFEKLGLQGDGVQDVLADLVFTENAPTRLFLNMCQHESQRPPGQATQSLHVATAIIARLPDEKGAEDVHQFNRDAGRAKRHRAVPLSTLYNSQIVSGVLKARGVKCPVITPDAIAQTSLQSMDRQTAPKMSFHSHHKDWPDNLNKVLSPTYKGSAPMVPRKTVLHGMAVASRA